MELYIRMFDLTAAANEGASFQMGSGTETSPPDEPFQTDEDHIMRKTPRRFVIQRQRFHAGVLNVQFQMVLQILPNAG